VKTEAVDLRTAEQCLHDRSGAAFAAAAAAGLPGRFRAFERDGLLALLTTSPGLGFLNSVCGLTSESLDALPGVLAVFAAAGAPLPRLATDGPVPAGRLRRLGFGPAKARPVATIDLPPRRRFPAEPHGLRLTEAQTPEQERVFLDTLAAGYEVPPELSRFLRAEHGAGGMRRFVAWQGPQPVAAAAFSMHGHVAVLGGAATIPAARRSGAQVALLRHRLNQAAAAGADAATATAAAESASVRNLARIGFEIHYRPGWEVAANAATSSRNGSR
jgi:GNAT superfamily N-acetyltransferase